MKKEDPRTARYRSDQTYRERVLARNLAYSRKRGVRPYAEMLADLNTSSHRPEVIAKKRERDLLRGGDHCHARCWSLRSPEGKIYQFRNLSHFIRSNRQLFMEEQLSRGTRNIAAALATLSPRRKKVLQTAYGWTWHIDHESVDLLNREYLV